MKLNHPAAEIFIPDGQPEDSAFPRVTHLGIGAHQDDLEFMAFHGILECFGKSDQWFGGVTCTDGHGSSRTGPYAGCPDDELGKIRRSEQNTAAVIGQYAAMVQLGYSSREVNDPHDSRLKNDLVEILKATRPQVVYTHNPADKHRTHIGVFASLLAAIRALPSAERPTAFIGCEVWRDLDWLSDQHKVIMNVSDRPNLAAALNGVFDSQIAGGKRYDLAIAGRRASNATFYEPRSTDHATQVIVGMNLLPLITNDSLDPVEYVTGFVQEFANDIRQNLNSQLHK